MPPSSAVTVIPRKRRGVELALILFALPITLSAYALVDYNVTGQLSVNFAYLAGICTAPGAGGPLRRALATALRRPGHPALRDRAQRARTGDDPPDRPDQRTAAERCPAAVDLDHARGDLVHRRGRDHPRPQAAAPVHLHHRPVRHRAAAAAAGARTRHREVRGEDLDRGRRVQLPAGRGGQGAAVHRLRRLSGGEARGAGAGRVSDTRPGSAAGPRSGSHRGDLGRSAWPSWCCSATWARRCCSSGCS